MYKFKNAFTLAETLIVIGIIGIIAALTIPTLLSNYQEKVFESTQKDAVNRLSNAAALLKVDQGLSNLSESYMSVSANSNNYDSSVGTFLNSYFKVEKSCPKGNNTDGCLSATYLDANDEPHPTTDFSNKYQCAFTNIGFTVCMRPFRVNSSASILVDANGSKNPNALGRDIACYRMDTMGVMSPTDCKANISDVILTSGGSYGTTEWDQLKNLIQSTMGVNSTDAWNLVYYAYRSPVVVKTDMTEADAAALVARIGELGGNAQLK